MSLKDKYNQSVGADQKNKKTTEQLRAFENCGFALFHYYNDNPTDPTYAECLLESAQSSSPLKLPSSAQSLILEAIEIIKPEKWKCIVMNYSNRDFYTVDRELAWYDVYLSPSSFPGDYVKYKWPDGSIHFNCVGGTHANIHYMGTKIGAKLRLNEEAKTLIKKANQYRENVQPYLYGRQEYVVLNPDSLDNKVYILFRDGTLFSQFGSEKEPIFNDNDKLEQFLINSIKRINSTV